MNNFISNKYKRKLLNLSFHNNDGEKLQNGKIRIDDKFLYNFVYDINSIDDWVKLRTELETLELLNSFHVTSFNLSKVEGIINFSGNNNKLELIMSQNNIDVANMGPYYKISLYD